MFIIKPYKTKIQGTFFNKEIIIFLFRTIPNYKNYAYLCDIKDFEVI